jgi:tetratricopeptide (TPR) repeat protein
MLTQLIRSLFGDVPARVLARRRKLDAARVTEGLNRALALETSGDLAAALATLDALIAEGHQLAWLLARAGSLSGRLGRLPRARELLESALKLEPALTATLIDLGNVHQLQGDTDRAIHCYREALRSSPDDTVALGNLGRCLAETNQPDAAFEVCARGLALEPRNENALRGLAALAGRYTPETEIGRILAEIARSQPGYGVAQAVYGYYVLKRESDPATALRLFDRAVENGCRDAETLGNRAIALQDLGRLDEALEAYDAALACDPENGFVRWHRALALLLGGRFEQGWDEYHLRMRSGDWARAPLPYPVWDGAPRPGQKLLICAEQGLGDEIMFAGCFAEAMARVGSCVIDCNPKLAGLFARAFPQARIHSGDQRAPADWLRSYEPIDCWISAGSLPAFFRRGELAFPRHSGYLRADPERSRRWRERLAASSLRPVGLSWRGGTASSRSRMRSLQLEQLLPLLKTPGVRWVSLQYDADSAELDQFAARHGIEISHWPEAIGEYEETAALVAALELTVSVCTAVVHLAGALGRPVWVLAPHSPEWRYGASGETMPWYPSARVFRQGAGGGWAPLVAQAAAALGGR